MASGSVLVLASSFNSASTWSTPRCTVWAQRSTICQCGRSAALVRATQSRGRTFAGESVATIGGSCGKTPARGEPSCMRTPYCKHRPPGAQAKFRKIARCALGLFRTAKRECQPSGRVARGRITQGGHQRPPIPVQFWSTTTAAPSARLQAHRRCCRLTCGIIQDGSRLCRGRAGAGAGGHWSQQDAHAHAHTRGQSAVSPQHAAAAGAARRGA